MTANQATAGGWLFVALSAGAYYFGFASPAWRWLLWCVPFLALGRLAMNALDGMLARAHGTATAAGELWNEAGDVAGDTIAYGVLFFVPQGPVLSLTLFLLLTWAAEFIGVLGKSLPGGRRRHESIGGGKPERAVWLSLFALGAALDPSAIERLPSYLLLVSALIALTCAVRIRKALVAARGKPYESVTAFGV